MPLSSILYNDAISLRLRFVIIAARHAKAQGAGRFRKLLGSVGAFAVAAAPRALCTGPLFTTANPRAGAATNSGGGAAS